MNDDLSSGGLWLFAILALMWGGGFGGFGGNGFANAIGYENLATSNEVQRGFDNQNQMANQREILSAVTNGTAQSVAATNQTFHDLLGVISDKYNETTRDIYGVSSLVQQAMANQAQCCCDTKMLITEGINSIKEQMSQNKIEALQGRVNQLELQQAVSGVVRYPNSMAYNAGTSPFCNCNSCGCYA
jgi:hypothetical protein